MPTLSNEDFESFGAPPKVLGNDEFENAGAKQPSGTGYDIAASGAAGAGQGMSNFLGAAGDLRNLASHATDIAGRTLGVDPSKIQTIKDVASKIAPAPLAYGPTSQDVRHGIEGVTGEFHKPETTYGKYARSIAEVGANPASYIGPGGVPAKLIGAAASGAGSEAAGQALEGESAEGPARFIGSLLGGLGAGKLSSTAANIMRSRGVQTTEQLRQAADNAYGQARSLGVEYTPSNLVILRDQIRRDLLQKGHRADKSEGTFNRIKELPDPLTPGIPGGNRNFSDIEGVRQSLNEIRDEVHPHTGKLTADAKAANTAINHIDDFLANPQNAIPAHRGIAQQAAELAEEGRGNWAAMSRSRQIEQALSKGELNAASSGSGANIDNALRQQVKQILTNPKRAKNFTADDRAMMHDIVAGNPIRNSARLLGKMAATGIVSAAGIEYLTHAMGLGPIGHALVPAAGYIAKKAGDYMTRARIGRLSENIRMDSPAGRANPVPGRRTARPFVLRSAVTTPYGTMAPNPYQP